MSFFSKFFELQDLMISHNAGLTKPHPYSSGPGGWPFVLRGISFWEKKEGLKQIYLLGNPIVWWMSITATMMYAAMWVLDRTLLQRGIDDFGGLRRRWFHRSIGFLFVAWALHWFPFFLMGRMLFLHHYLPSMIFSTMITAAVFDFVGRLLGQDYSRFKGRLNVPMTQWMSGEVGFMYSFCLLVLGALSLICFFYFSPLTYGTGFDTIEELRARKWLESWDLQHA